jgi:hypothetical protein
MMLNRTFFVATGDVRKKRQVPVAQKPLATYISRSDMQDADHVRAFCFNRKEQVAAGRKLMDLLCDMDERNDDDDEKQFQADLTECAEISARHKQHIREIPLSLEVKRKLPNFVGKVAFIVESDFWLAVCPEYGAVFKFPCSLPPDLPFSSPTRVGDHLVFFQTDVFRSKSNLLTLNIYTDMVRDVGVDNNTRLFCAQGERRILTACNKVFQKHWLVGNGRDDPVASVMLPPAEDDVMHLASSPSHTYLLYENMRGEVRDSTWQISAQWRINNKANALGWLASSGANKDLVVMFRYFSARTELIIRDLMDATQRRVLFSMPLSYKCIVHGGFLFRIDSHRPPRFCAVFNPEKMDFGPDVMLESINF